MYVYQPKINKLCFRIALYSLENYENMKLRAQREKCVIILRFGVVFHLLLGFLFWAKPKIKTLKASALPDFGNSAAMHKLIPVILKRKTYLLKQASLECSITIQFSQKGLLFESEASQPFKSFSLEN